jgi:hypothetical protein
MLAPRQHRRGMIDEQFRRWVTAPVSMPPVPGELHAALSETGDLAEMIEIVREAELSCMQRLQECNRQSRLAREAAGTGEWARTIELLVSHREAVEWDARIKWLQDVRRHLEKKRQRSEIACAAI